MLRPKLPSTREVLSLSHCDSLLRVTCRFLSTCPASKAALPLQLAQQQLMREAGGMSRKAKLSLKTRPWDPGAVPPAPLRACMWPWGCMKPPMTPNTAKSCSSPVALSVVAAAGMMVWNGRLRGARQFGCAGSRMKLAPRFCMHAESSSERELRDK